VRRGDQVPEPARDPPAGRPASIAVCALTSRHLVGRLYSEPAVAIVGTLMTANLGIEQLVRTVVRRPEVRGLVVCGRDSPRFRAGQSLVSLIRSGVGAGGDIVGADGYRPRLRELSQELVEAFRTQVVLEDVRGHEDVGVLCTTIRRLSIRLDGDGSGVSGAPPRTAPQVMRPSSAHSDGRRATGFVQISPVGRRRTLETAGRGFVVIAVDRDEHRIVLRHYGPDLEPLHEMRGSRAESMLLGLLGAGVVAELDHAGYLGAELAKAETALRLGLHYEQDLPLRGEPPARV